MTNTELTHSVIKQFAKENNKAFFRESDIVWTLQKKLIEALEKTEYKVFHEYPVKPPVPLRITFAKWDKCKELLKNSKQKISILEKFYSKHNRHHILDPNTTKTDINNIIKPIIAETENAGKGEKEFEPIYMDLAIVKMVDDKTDLETKPEIIIQVKYEPDIKKRNGRDFRKNRTEIINSKADIEYDLRTIDHCLHHKEIACGFFVFLNEAERYKDYPKEYKNGEIECNGNNLWVFQKNKTNK